MIEIYIRWEPYAEIIQYHPKNDAWEVMVMEESDSTFHMFTSESISGWSDVCISDDLDYILRMEEVRLCGECNNEPMFDQKSGEYYCPVCNNE